ARSDSCNSGSLHCCNETVSGNSPSVSSIASLLGIAGSATSLVGIKCTPLAAIGISSNNCAQQTACCTGNSFNGLVNVACTPVNVQA
ncbi:fungal hydrophobin, partial [Coprinellus micaceus]